MDISNLKDIEDRLTINYYTESKVRKNTGLIYFQRYLKIAPLSLALWRATEAQELARHKLTKPVLDIGCGFGEFAGVFFNSQIEVGVDIDYRDIAKATSSGKYKKTIIADARNLPFGDNTFNTIISISTLEHIQNNFEVFKEAYRVLKPGGKFYYTVPTDKLADGLLTVNIFNFLRLKKLSAIYFRIFNKVFKHVFLPNEQTWIKLTKKAGFKVVDVKGTLPKITLFLFELALPFSLPSQLGRLFLGNRLVFAPNLKIKLLRPLVRFIKSDPDFRANIFVIASKPIARK